MSTSDWRTPAAYTYIRHISAAGLAWEYLRRDDDYRRDVHRVKMLPQSDREALAEFAGRWGLRFRSRSE